MTHNKDMTKDTQPSVVRAAHKKEYSEEERWSQSQSKSVEQRKVEREDSLCTGKHKSNKCATRDSDANLCLTQEFIADTNLGSISAVLLFAYY